MSKKRLISGFLTISMLLTLAACGEVEKEEELKEVTVGADGREMLGDVYVSGYPIVDEPQTIEILYSMTGLDLSSDANDKIFIHDALEATNVGVDIEAINTGFDEKLSLMFAGGTAFPDVIIGASGSTIVKNTGHLVELTEDMLRTYAPNITAQIEANVEGGLDALKQADGKIYSLPIGVYSEKQNAVTGVPVIRADWLEAVGMEMPTTTDELYDVLYAFKHEDPNGNGVADEIPLLFCNDFWAAKHMSFAGPWGIGGNHQNAEHNYYRVENGVFKPMINTENYRSYLEFMNKLMVDELVNIDGFSMTGAQYQSLTAEDNYGMTGVWAEQPDEWLPVPVLTATGYEGQAVKQGQEDVLTALMDGFVITSGCESPEMALRWWDYLHSDPNIKRTVRNGEEGLLWTDDGDGTATVNIPEIPDGFDSQAQYNHSIGWRNHCPIMFEGDVAEPDFDAEVLSNDAIRYQYFDMYVDYLPTEFLPTTPVPESELLKRDLVQLEIEAVVEAYTANAIIGGVTDENWDEYLKDLENAGLEQWTNWYQDYIDGAF